MTDSPPATLDEIPSHPEWLQVLSVRADQPYSIEADSLTNPQVMPIVEAAFWSRRMSRLERVLPTEDACVLFDPPVDDLGRPGMIKRLQAACPMVKADGFKPWPYPGRQRQAFTPALEQQIQVGFGPPLNVNVDPQTQVAMAVPEYKLLKIRTDQLLGKFEDATQRYLLIRRLELPEVEANRSPEILQLHRLAAENAIYWSGASKFEAEEYDAVVEQLVGYLKRFDRKGRWTFAARSLLAECHARQSRFAEAIATIERTIAEDPYREGNAIRVKRWKSRPNPAAAAPAK